MSHRHQPIASVHDLRDYVNKTICSRFELREGAFTLSQRVLMRGNKPCGMYFCLHGPRATKFIAIWETDRNQVLFYGTRGERVLKTQLLDVPSLDTAAA
ncbi:MAG: hypothetical protein ABFC63_04285 [Thermoguttaceae bacterium]